MRVCPRCSERFSASLRFCPNDNSALVEDLDLLRLGSALGNYELQEILGRGGMGTVYRGEHIYIRKKVAVKVLHARYAKYNEAIERFLREARAASSIQHPNIVDVTDFGITEDKSVFFVMEYLEGTSLEERIEKSGRLELHQALNIANQICLALAAAHEQNIVHRDLKPENIMLIRKPGRRNIVRAVSPDVSGSGYVTEREDEFDFVKVLDFGIAKVMFPDDHNPESTRGAVFGTPEYMSPEAARGEDVDFRSDIYSIGVILFDMVTGRPPFEHDNADQVLAMHIHKPPPSARAAAPGHEITEACERLIFRAMAKDPQERYQSMDEFREELQQCYGSVAYRRNANSIPGAVTIGIEARRAQRLTEEIGDWVKGDGTGLSLAEARMLAMQPRDTEPHRVPPLVTPPLNKDEEERLADALDAALDDDW